jgi:hypothetical protein
MMQGKPDEIIGRNAPRQRRFNALGGSSSVVFVDALAMIGQDFDDAAVGHSPTSALADHAFKLSLERGKARNPLLHFGQTGARNLVGRCTGLVGMILERKQGADRVDLEPQLAGMADEHQPAQIAGIVETAIALGARQDR